MRDINMSLFANKYCSILTRIITVILLVSLVVSCCSCNRIDNNDFDGVRFGNTRHITVAVDPGIFKDIDSDKTSSSLTDISVSNSSVAQYIHDQVLADCNIDVEFISSSNTRVANGTATDVFYMNEINSINTYYRMNAILNIKPYLDEYRDSLDDLYLLLGDDNVYSCDTYRSEVWYLSPRNLTPEANVTFIRKDWLDILGLKAPQTREELHECLLSFRDNADLLLGDDSSSMIPFFIDNEPNKSAKPLFDSCFDVSINDIDFYVSGYCRTTQQGYEDGLQILNSWYLEGLLPTDFTEIRPGTKESYEPIEKGYVGAFCAKYDYLYKNGENSHINALHYNCGNDSDYIAVNTFENSRGQYTYWHEDYLDESGYKIYLPATCSDPLACLVYLNWISDVSHIYAVQEISASNPDDPYKYDRYLLTCRGEYPNGEEFSDPEAETARETANEIEYISRGTKCLECGPSYLKYFSTGIDFSEVYPGSTQDYVCKVITAPLDEFENVYYYSYSEYMNERGAYFICVIRQTQWEKVMEEGNLSAW